MPGYVSNSSHKRKADDASNKVAKRPYQRKMVIPVELKRYVKRAIAATEEAKVTNLVGAVNPQGYTIAGLASSWYSQCVIPVTPYGGFLNITQGSGEGDRIGNKIRTKRLVFEYVINARQYDVTTNPLPTPQDIKMWFLTSRDDPTTLPTQGSFTSFFQAGDTAVAPTGLIQDLLYSVNEDLFKVHATREHKVGYQFANGTGAQAGFQYLTNNDYAYNVRGKIDLTKYIPKTFHFNDNAPYPNNPLCYLVMEAVPATGFSNGITQPLLMNYSIKYEFTDA